MRWVAGAGALGAAALGLSACEPAGISLVVTTDADGPDADPGDGVCEMTAGAGDCSLRAALDEANALPDHETITFTPSVSSLYLFGEGDDTNQTGDLDITDGVTIDGGATGVAVEGTEHDRVFDVHGGDPAPFVTFRNLTIAGGNADEGGGLRLIGPQQTTLERSAVVWNVGYDTGGGVHVGPGATLAVTNSTIGENWSDGAGGAIWSAGTVSLNYSTVANNHAASGAVERDPSATGPLNVLASVIGLQEATPPCAGAVSSLGSNVVVDTSCAFAAAGDQQGIDPLLGALGDHGGPTETYLPYQDSPAVDAVDGAGLGCGTLFPVDARGIVRPQHGDCDAGAVEVEYLPMEMGRGTNYLGTGSDPASILPPELHENFWLAVSGPCASAENGDLLSTVSDATYYVTSPPYDANPGPVGSSIGWNLCTGADAQGTTEVNADYDPNGYFYAVDVAPEHAGEPLYVDVYDAAHCQSSSAGDSSASDATNRRFVTRYRVRGPDGSPVATDNPILPGGDLSLTSATTSGVCATATSLTGGGYRNGWRQLIAVAAADAGRYYVQVNTQYSPSTPAEAFQGTNSFALRARHGTFAPCSTDPATPGTYDATCPAIHAVGWAGALVSLQGTYPSFGLGELPAGADGGVLQVDVWDPGEGSRFLEVLDPLDRSVTFDWEVIDRSGSDVMPTGGWSGVVAQPGGVPCVAAPPGCAELDVLGSDPQADSRGWNPQPGPYRGSRSKYSDRLLALTTTLPEDLEAEYGDARRLRIRYHAWASPTDRVMWRSGVWEVGPAPTP
jgi:CSLREA domain-containing protein